MKEPPMRLVEVSSGRELKEGDHIIAGRHEGHISGTCPKKDWVFLFPDRDNQAPYAVPARALGAVWRS